MLCKGKDRGNILNSFTGKIWPGLQCEQPLLKVQHQHEEYFHARHLCKDLSNLHRNIYSTEQQLQVAKGTVGSQNTALFCFAHRRAMCLGNKTFPATVGKPCCLLCHSRRLTQQCKFTGNFQLPSAAPSPGTCSTA